MYTPDVSKFPTCLGTS